MPPRQTIEEFTQGEELTFEQPERISFEEFSQGEKVSVFKPESEQERLSFTQRFGEDLQKRQSLLEEISDAVTSGEQSFAEGVLQTAGKVGVGGTFDFIAQGFISAFRLLPDFIEKPLRNAGTYFLDTNIGKIGLSALEKGTQKYEEFKAQNPRAARNIEAVVNVGLLLAPVKPRVKAPPTRIGKVAEKLEERVIAQEVSKRESFISELVRPAPTKAVREAEVPRTAEKGLLRIKRVEPSVSEKAIIEEVGKISSVSNENTLQRNFNIISKENKVLAEKLKLDIAKNDFIYPKQQLISDLNKTKIRLGENPLIVGDAEKVGEKLLNKFQQFIKSEEGKGSGILEARKKFDRWVESQKGTNIFDPKNENALSISLREIRRTANDFLDRNATNVEVKESLRRQSRLFRALENITPKAASEGGNIAIRAWQNILRVLPFRGEFNQIMAVLIGVGGLGASAMFAPFFTKIVMGALFTFGVTKAITGSTTKKLLSHLLKGVDEAIRKTKDANLIQELRADRVLILEILENSNESTNFTRENEVE